MTSHMIAKFASHEPRVARRSEKSQATDLTEPRARCLTQDQALVCTACLTNQTEGQGRRDIVLTSGSVGVVGGLFESWLRRGAGWSGHSFERVWGGSRAALCFVWGLVCGGQEVA